MEENTYKYYDMGSLKNYYNSRYKDPYDYGYTFIDDLAIKEKVEKDELLNAIELILDSPDSLKELYNHMELTRKKLIMELILNDPELL